ncbi:exodeoxyribonuclease VII large subunit [Halanaerobiaceae bacterium Z-7014]|uniref:Exodeoxyribonuclease 7 large subunit n=1 Tax=Halonatronomonas betaini TaxID=2778430 RepID=A0A931AVK1_9FIRM|nr:exodeoxyribonuclease VII large subunit [Halonatronomonas betaini]MBF8437565.1 exodeoxyribonuclease VII large subunit [Halonatronomonas betaini]
MESKHFTVSEVTRYIKQLLKNDDILNQIEVVGEISNFHHHRSGHMYFSLKDDDSKINAVMFKGNNYNLDFQPEDGQKVRAFGYIDLYVPRGEYQLYVEAMSEEGEGDLYQKFLMLKEKLEKEGLFADENKQPIPEFPKKIGLVTSAGGAAIRDIISVINRRDSRVSILVASARVQGSESVGELIESLRYLDSRDDIDLIILSRGGGSLEDLWSFNDEILAREIVEAKTPIISGVGHETDFTIADMAADLRAPTPSAAAELAVRDMVSIRNRFKNLNEQLYYKINKKVKDARKELGYILKNRIWRNPELIISDQRQEFDNISNEFSTAMENYFRDKHDEIAKLSLKLDGLSPLKILSRGYSITEKLEEDRTEVVSSVDDLKRGDLIKTLLNNGQVLSEVKKIKEASND